jgi:hypothetical protein
MKNLIFGLGNLLFYFNNGEYKKIDPLISKKKEYDFSNEEFKSSLNNFLEKNFKKFSNLNECIFKSTVISEMLLLGINSIKSELSIAKDSFIDLKIKDFYFELKINKFEKVENFKNKLSLDLGQLKKYFNILKEKEKLFYTVLFNNGVESIQIQKNTFEINVEEEK